MLKKLFGRNKQQQNQEKESRNKDSPPQTYASTPISAVEQETTSNEEKQVELATFSAQFPPPEWQWYESQHRQEQFPPNSHPPHIGKQILSGMSLQYFIYNLKQAVNGSTSLILWVITGSLRNMNVELSTDFQ